MNIYIAYDHDRDLYVESYFISLNNDVQTIMLAHTSLDTPQSCDEKHLTSTRASFVRFLRYFSLNSSARREGSTTCTGWFNDVLSSPLVLRSFFCILDFVYSDRRLSTRAFFGSLISCMNYLISLKDLKFKKYFIYLKHLTRSNDLRILNHFKTWKSWNS